MLMRRLNWIFVLAAFCLCRWGNTAETGSLIAQLKAVGKEGKGNVEAAKAWQELARQGPEVLPDVLAGLDDASPRAANWLRAVVDAVAERALAAGKLPPAPLEAFLQETRHAGHARRLAFEWLVKADPKARARLLPGMINDPGAELRREAVAEKLKDAQQLFDGKDETAARAAYEKILDAARDRDQVELIAKRLEKLGVKIDLTAQFGFITRWALIGPFDNSKELGFHTPNPPERGIDLKAEYEGKDAKKVRWFTHVTDAPLGLVDFNKTVAPIKGATAFGFAAVVSPQERPVEIRAASNNAVRIWLNGKEIYFREEYHHGMELDQHVGKGTLTAGRNEILIKVCQNEQSEDWAKLWSFQLRVCDGLGGAVPVTVVTEKLPAKNSGE